MRDQGDLVQGGSTGSADFGSLWKIQTTRFANRIGRRVWFWSVQLDEIKGL